VTHQADAELSGRALFVHDHHFIACDGRMYSEVQYSAEHWTRYLNVFTELMVVGRSAELRPGLQVERLLCSSRAGVSFTLLPNLSSVFAQLKHRVLVVRQMRELVATAGWVVARVPSELGLLAISVAREMGKPYLVEVVDCAWDGLWHYGGWRGKVYAPVMAWRVRRAVAQAAWVHYVTQVFLQRRYPNFGGQQMVCSNVDISPIDTAVAARRLRRIDESATTQAFSLGLIGTLATRHKGVQTVLAALPALVSAFPGLTFRVLGGGDPKPWRVLAEQLGIADRVFFDGVLPPGEAVSEWLDSIDLYLHPSFKEGLPRALIEAMSRGCPALASKVGGIPELLEPDCLFAAGDVLALVRGVTAALSESAWLGQQAQRNLTVAAGYSRDLLQQKRLDFLRSFRESALLSR
jgi:glycosyltransferase involved in cell wall biosynthesis